jgi:amino acid adenylation domain-containing protein
LEVNQSLSAKEGAKLSTSLKSSELKKLTMWNQTKRDYPDLTLVELLEQQLVLTPNLDAVILGEQSLTFFELHQIANQWARYLQEIGVTRNSLVIVHLPRSLELVVLLLAILKAGGAYLPIDVKQPLKRVKLMITDSKARFCISDSSHKKELISLFDEGKLLAVDSINQLAASCSMDALPNINTPDDLSYVIYTSGSTGAPKGVANIHKGTVNTLLWMQEYFQLNTTDRFLQKNSIGFDISVTEFWWPLVSGACLVLAPADAEQDFINLTNAIIKYKITIIQFVPSHLAAFTQSGKLKECITLNNVICIGEPLLEKHKEDFLHASSAALYNFYGPTEASIYVSFFPCNSQIHPDTLNSTVVPIGKPMANNQFYVLNEIHQVLPLGEIGELYIAGKSLAKGYWHNDLLTEQKFVKINLWSGKTLRAYKTGDLARWLSDGNLEFMGRVDNQIKIRGYRIELAEIEAIALKHETIAQAAVTVKHLPNGQPNLVGYGVLKLNQSQPSETVWRHFLEKHLPEYMIPKHWIWLDNLPLTLSQKLDKKALPNPHWAFSKNQPSTELEKSMALLWEKQLNMTAIGLHDNFFALGGDSLSAMLIAAQARTHEISMRAQWIFHYPTIHLLSSYIESLGNPKFSLPIPVFEQTSKKNTIFHQRIANLLKYENNLNSSEIEAIYPLTSTQQGILFQSIQSPGLGMYLNQISLNIHGNLDSRWIKKVWQTLLMRHALLRTAFYFTELDTPVQVVYKCAQVVFSYKNLSHLLSPKQEEQIKKFLTEDSQKDFVFKHPPLWRIALFKLTETSYTLIYTDHHAISDGLSQGVLWKEFFHLYEMYKKGLDPRLSPAPPFVTYVDWLTMQDPERAKNYWQTLVKVIETPSIMGIDKQRALSCKANQNYAWKSIALSQELTTNLQSLAKQTEVTISTIVQTGWTILLSRYSPEEPIVYGLTDAGLHMSGSEVTATVGNFLQTFPVVMKIKDTWNVTVMCKQLQQQIIESAEYSYYPLVAIQQLTALPKRTALFRYTITFLNRGIEHILEDENNRFFQFENFTRRSKTHYPLTIIVVLLNNQLHFHFMYSNEHFESDDILKISQHWQHLLLEMTRNPNQKVINLPILLTDERQQLLYEYNSNECDYPLDKTVIDFFETQVKKTPEKIAVVFENLSLTYQQLNEKANRLAYYLRENGTKPEANIVIYLERGMDLIISVLAVLKAGGAYVGVDSVFPFERVEHIIKDCNAHLIISCSKLIEPLCEYSSLNNKLVDVDRFFFLDKTILTTNRQGYNNPERLHHSRNAMYIIYTSGTTGKPKGVVIEHRSVMHLLFSTKNLFHFSSTDVWTLFHSISFDFSVWEIFGALIYGGKLIIVANDLAKDTQLFYQLLLENQVTVLNQTPSAFYSLIEVAKGYFTTEEKRLKNLKKIIFGGENLSFNQLDKWINLYGEQSPELINMFGITETTVHVTYHRIKDNCLSGFYTPIGRALPGIKLYVVDKYMQLVPENIAGELLVGGDVISRNYLNQPELTAQKFIKNPFSNIPEKLYMSGDMVRWVKDGTLEYIGRIDDQIKLRGFRIELKEIENALAEMEVIKEAKVMLYPHQTQSTTMNKIIAYLIPANNIHSKINSSEILYKWQQLYDQVYSQDSSTPHFFFNTTGWKSSYTLENFSEEEMLEWRNATLDRIQSLNPKRILEIGCGTGLLLFSLVENCEKYTAIDSSITSLNFIKQQLYHLGGGEKVSLKHGMAHQILEAESALYDTIIINSVVQYFPDADYLWLVLQQALRLVRPGGQIFIGDVRSYAHLTQFHMAVQLARAVSVSSLKELQSKAIFAVQHEEELVIAPEFFYCLAEQTVRISAIDIELKRGRFSTEMNQFRYDVVIHVEKPVSTLDAVEQIPWEEKMGDIKSLEYYLDSQSPEFVELTHIPNARLAGLEQLVGKDDMGSLEEITEFVKRETDLAIEPELLTLSAEKRGYAAYLTWDSSHPSYFCAIIYRSELFSKIDISKHLTPLSSLEKFNQYTNNPKKNIQLAQLSAYLRTHLSQTLPTAMIPSAFIWLERWPITVNGKLDKQALPLPQFGQSGHAPTEPRNPLEKELISIWQGVLGVETLGIESNFFDCGGHSLLVVELVSKMSAFFNFPVKIAEVMEFPTVEKFANFLSHRLTKVATSLDYPKERLEKVQ